MGGLQFHFSKPNCERVRVFILDIKTRKPHTVKRNAFLCEAHQDLVVSISPTSFFLAETSQEKEEDQSDNDRGNDVTYHFLLRAVQSNK